METTCDNHDCGGAFVVGGLIGSSIVGLIANAKSQRRAQELQEAHSQGYWQGRNDMNEVLAAKDAEIARLNALLRWKDVEFGKQAAQIAQLTSSVQSLSAAVKAQELQMAAKIFPQNNDDISAN